VFPVSCTPTACAIAETIRAAFANRRQCDKTDAAGKLIGHFARCLQCEPRLSDATRTGESDKVNTRAAQKLAESSRFAFPSNECCALNRQVVAAKFRFPGRQICQAVTHGSEVASQIPCRGITLLRILGQATLYDPSEWGGCLQRFGAEAIGFVAKDCRRRFRMRLLSEGGGSGGHFVKNRPEGKLIRTKIQILADRLLRRHVANSADHRPMLGDGGARIRTAAVGLKKFRQTEIQYLGRAAGRNHQILGLEVTMNEANLVGFGETVGNLRCDCN
jgi:hypothetical protein